MHVDHESLGNAPVTGVIANIKHRPYYDKIRAEAKAKAATLDVASLKRIVETQKKTVTAQQKFIALKSPGLMQKIERLKKQGLPKWAKFAGAGAGVLLLAGGVYLARRR